MIGVLFVIGLFILLLVVVDKAEEFELSSQWPRPWDKSTKRCRL